MTGRIQYLIYDKKVFRTIKAIGTLSVPECQELIALGIYGGLKGYWITTDYAKAIVKNYEAEFIPMNAETLIRTSIKKGIDENTMKGLIERLVIDL